MTTKLYLVPLPDSQTTTPPEEGVAAQVQAAGLVQEAGIATEKIATESVDLTVTGQYRLGEFSKKLHREIQSLGESSYEAVPFADDANVDSDDQSGYYEVATVDSNRAHEASTLAYEYTVGLNQSGTRNTQWRAVDIGTETISTGFEGTHAGSYGGATYGGVAYGEDAEGIDNPKRVGIPAEASKVRWFDTAQGTEPASVAETVTAEFGDVDLYDPDASSFTDPTIIYELAFDREGPVDVRVWDDVGAPNSKQLSYDEADGTTQNITQWVHAYHPGFEYEGQPIVDNGLLRVRFDEGNGVIEAEEWDTGTSSWSDISIDMGDWSLYDADIEAIGPADVQVFVEFEDSSTGDVEAAVLSIQRGLSRAVVRQPANGTIPDGVKPILGPIAADSLGDASPAQTVKPRTEVK